MLGDSFIYVYIYMSSWHGPAAIVLYTEPSRAAAGLGSVYSTIAAGPCQELIYIYIRIPQNKDPPT